MAANVEKSPLMRFVDELDFKQIPVSVKRKRNVHLAPVVQRADNSYPADKSLSSG